MARNVDLVNAKSDRKDEFYTSLSDIEQEMKNYRSFFAGKTVFCNCDDPYESNFFKYFAMNFQFLGLKKLIATCFDGSPITGTQLSLFDFDASIDSPERTAYKVEITEIPDLNNDGAVDLSDVETLLKSKNNVLTKLEGNGDYASEECLTLLKEADVVCTNPPFSKWRPFFLKLMEYKKKFIILGNVNAITYKELFPFINQNEVWLGQSIHSGDREFRVPDDYPLNAATFRVDDKGIKYIRVKGVRWWTNVDYPQRHEDLILYKKYNEADYQRYANYDAINVDNTSDIPLDYSGTMGVPITFLDKYNPDQFEIIGITKTPLGNKLRTIVFDKQIQHNPDGSMEVVTKANDGALLENDNPPKNKPWYEIDGKKYKAVYPRILIKRRTQK